MSVDFQLVMLAAPVLGAIAAAFAFVGARALYDEVGKGYLEASNADRDVDEAARLEARRVMDRRR